MFWIIIQNIDVQVIGFDGIRFFGDKNYLCSTIVQPIPDIAKMCVRLLLDENWREKPSFCAGRRHFCSRDRTAFRLQAVLRQNYRWIHKGFQG